MKVTYLLIVPSPGREHEEKIEEPVALHTENGTQNPCLMDSRQRFSDSLGHVVDLPT